MPTLIRKQDNIFPFTMSVLNFSKFLIENRKKILSDTNEALMSYSILLIIKKTEIIKNVSEDFKSDMASIVWKYVDHLDNRMLKLTTVHYVSPKLLKIYSFKTNDSFNQWCLFKN